MRERSMSLTVIDHFHPQKRSAQQAAIVAGHIQQIDALELLSTPQLVPLARLSLLMLLLGTIGMFALNFIAYGLHTAALVFHLTLTGMLFWVLINFLGYILILPLHELIHGAIFLLLGGKPYFGAKLPLALYCGARQQLFRRNQYLFVGLAPLIVITLAAIVLTFVAPVLAAYTLFASIGNFAGAAGDVWVAARLWHCSADTLVEDTESGYRAWLVELD